MARKSEPASTRALIFARLSHDRIAYSYVVQPRPRGTVHVIGPDEKITFALQSEVKAESIGRIRFRPRFERWDRQRTGPEGFKKPVLRKLRQYAARGEHLGTVPKFAREIEESIPGSSWRSLEPIIRDCLDEHPEWHRLFDFRR